LSDVALVFWLGWLVCVCVLVLWFSWLVEMVKAFVAPSLRVLYSSFPFVICCLFSSVHLNLWAIIPGLKFVCCVDEFPDSKKVDFLREEHIFISRYINDFFVLSRLSWLLIFSSPRFSLDHFEIVYC